MNRHDRRQRGREQPRRAAPALVKRPALRRPTVETALEHHRAGRLDQAAAIYQGMLAAEPRHPDALHLLGVIALQTGQPTLASQLIRDAIASNPAAPAFYHSLGSALLAQGDRPGAVASFRTALVLDPNSADGHDNLGTILEQAGDLAGACESYQQALALRPTIEAHCKLGRVLLALGRTDAGVEVFRRRLALSPRSAEAHNDLGVALHGLGDVEAALASFEAALACSPDHVDAHKNLGWVTLRRNQPVRAEHHLQRVVALAPGNASVHDWLGVALRDQGRVTEAAQCMRRAVELAPDDATLGSSLLFTLHQDPTCSPDALFDEAVAWGRRHGAPLAGQICPHRNRPEPDRRLRIGYLAAGFCHHPVGNFLAAILATHDPAQIEVFAYANDHQADDLTAHLRSMTHHWREVAHLDDATTADLIRADEIDVLVDLMGHTVGNRLLVCARKPAPVQASWLGYFDTTGLEAIDYIIGDRWVCPAGDEARYVERVVRLPESYLCYTPLHGAPEPGAPPRHQRGYPTFGCFNNLAKISPEVVQLWAAVLHRVQDAHLLLKAPSLSDAGVRAYIASLFTAHEIGAERLEFLGTTSQREHLAAYADIDVALDPFPYNGGTTTAEAIWMGVPVVTLAGKTWVGRVGTSMLNAAGLSALVTATPEAYVDLAATLATDEPLLTELRSSLRARLAQSPLCDAASFTRSLEAAYREMWRAWCLDQAQS
jgi:predicted O-linked N-acetylglucosamine transferase (SPINDLY family)